MRDWGVRTAAHAGERDGNMNQAVPTSPSGCSGSSTCVGATSGWRPVESARARALLGYLLLHGQAPHPRQRLAFLLWPDSTEGQARTNLRKVLHTVRRQSPEVASFLAVTPRTVQWRSELPCWVDVAEFESALKAADAGDPGADEAVAALRYAVELYAGDLLEDCYDEWLVEERERFRDRYMGPTGSMATSTCSGGVSTRPGSRSRRARPSSARRGSRRSRRWCAPRSRALPWSTASATRCTGRIREESFDLLGRYQTEAGAEVPIESHLVIAHKPASSGD